MRRAAAMTSLRLSIVIATYEEPASLDTTLRALSDQRDRSLVRDRRRGRRLRRRGRRRRRRLEVASFPSGTSGSRTTDSGRRGTQPCRIGSDGRLPGLPRRRTAFRAAASWLSIRRGCSAGTGSLRASGSTSSEPFTARVLGDRLGPSGGGRRPSGSCARRESSSRRRRQVNRPGALLPCATDDGPGDRVNPTSPPVRCATATRSASRGSDLFERVNGFDMRAACGLGR